jgi:hypothetical protein
MPDGGRQLAGSADPDPAHEHGEYALGCGSALPSLSRSWPSTWLGQTARQVRAGVSGTIIGRTSRLWTAVSGYSARILPE